MAESAQELLDVCSCCVELKTVGDAGKIKKTFLHEVKAEGKITSTKNYELYWKR